MLTLWKHKDLGVWHLMALVYLLKSWNRCMRTSISEPKNLPHYFAAPKSFAIPFVECMISRQGKKLDRSRALRDCRRSPSGRVVISCKDVGVIPAA